MNRNLFVVATASLGNKMLRGDSTHDNVICRNPINLIDTLHALLSIKNNEIMLLLIFLPSRMLSLKKKEASIYYICCCCDECLYFFYLK